MASWEFQGSKSDCGCDVCVCVWRTQPPTVVCQMEAQLEYVQTQFILLVGTNLQLFLEHISPLPPLSRRHRSLFFSSLFIPRPRRSRCANRWLPGIGDQHQDAGCWEERRLTRWQLSRSVWCEVFSPQQDAEIIIWCKKKPIFNVFFFIRNRILHKHSDKATQLIIIFPSPGRQDMLIVEKSFWGLKKKTGKKWKHHCLIPWIFRSWHPSRSFNFQICGGFFLGWCNVPVLAPMVNGEKMRGSAANRHVLKSAKNAIFFVLFGEKKF